MERKIFNHYSRCQDGFGETSRHRTLGAEEQLGVEQRKAQGTERKDAFTVLFNKHLMRVENGH